MTSPLPLGLRAVRRLVFIQAVLVTVCLGTEIVRALLLHMHGVYIRPILIFPGDVFPDFGNWIGTLFDHYHTAAFFQPGLLHFMYPAGAGLVYEFFHIFGPKARLPLFVLTMGAVFVGATTLFALGMKRRGVHSQKAAMYAVAMLLLSYPVWFSFQRGNIEVDVWLVCALGVWAFYRRKGHTAAACFGLAAAFKLYPGIYLGLILARRQWKQLATGVATAILVTLIALWAMYPQLSRSLHETAYGLTLFSYHYVQHTNRAELSWDHSLFGLFKRLAHPDETGLLRASKGYTLATAGAGLLFYLTRIRKLPFPNQVIALTAAMVAFPPVSFDYTLLHLYTAVGIFVFACWEGVPTRSWVILSALLALALAPFSEFVSDGYNLEGQMKAVVLSSLFLAAVLLPLNTGNDELDPGYGRKTTTNSNSRRRSHQAKPACSQGLNRDKDPKHLPSFEEHHHV